MKKIIFVIVFSFFGLNFANATTYSNSADFLKAEWTTCVTATDWCNTVMINNWQLWGMTLMYCENTYGPNWKEEWSCLSDKKIEESENTDLTTEEVNIWNIVWNDRDEHWCIPSAWYSWSEIRKSCVRVWEVTDKLSENDKNLYNNLSLKLSKDVQKDLWDRLENFEKITSEFSQIKKDNLNKKVILFIKQEIRKLISKYPADSALPEKENVKYMTLKFLELEFRTR